MASIEMIDGGVMGYRLSIHPENRVLDDHHLVLVENIFEINLFNGLRAYHTIYYYPI